MSKRTVLLPLIPCKHETDSSLWRLCKGTNLRECTLCYSLEEVNLLEEVK